MRLITGALALLAASSIPLASAAASEEKIGYQSDVARLMRVVVSNLYNNPEVFLRELISNSGDALEKVRIQSLTDPSVLLPAPELNISVRAVEASGDGDAGKLIIRDTGIGMTRLELQRNLGTIARSGTSEFLNRLNTTSSSSASTNAGSNLIGQFGLGFYSAFLVANKVTVTSKNPSEDDAWVFESEADASEFVIRKAEQGREQELGRGTELVLHLRPEASRYLDSDTLKALIEKHSSFATTSPIYVHFPVSEADEPAKPETKEGEDAEAEVETATDAVKSDGKWEIVNLQPPVWMREPKDVQKEEYDLLFKSVFKEASEPLAYSHFSGEAGRTSFRSLLYIPATIPADFFTKQYTTQNSLRLHVRRVFITSDLGDYWLPRYLGWLKVIIDADDLPLNVGRDSLIKNRDLSRIKTNVVRKALDLFSQLSVNDPEKFRTFHLKAGTALKVGALDDTKNRSRLLKLIRFVSSRKDPNGPKIEIDPTTGRTKDFGDPDGNSIYWTTLDGYVSRKRKGQTQIFYMAGAGQSKKDMEKSPFVERLLSRGYEVLYLSEPMDVMLTSTLGAWGGLTFQDVAKKGLKFGDEDESDEAEKEELAEFKARYKPLINYAQKVLADSVSDVVISTLLTTSPCAVISDTYAWTGNMERLMAAQNAKEGENWMTTFMKTAKRVLEINPRHPLIEGLLERVNELELGTDEKKDEKKEEGEEKVEEVESEEEKNLKEIVVALWDTSMIKSGFNVREPDLYFSRIESLLRRALGVSQTASVAPETLKPAPEVDPEAPEDETPKIDTDAEAAAEVEEEDEEEKALRLKREEKVRKKADKEAEWIDWEKVKKSVDQSKAEGNEEEKERLIREVREKVGVKVENGEAKKHDEL